MKLRQIITEAVIKDSIKETKSQLSDIKKYLIEQMIIEGVHDPGILKCVFMAGGPGSGKSFTAMEIFGIDKQLKSSFSATGLKSVNSDTAFEAALKKNGIDPKDLAKIEAENPELWDKITKMPDGIRNKAKGITEKQKQFYEAGRLGMIIDGTGREADKIKKLKDSAEKLGYDTYMVFVNTSLKVARERNISRGGEGGRTIPDDVLVDAWQGVQDNLGYFKTMFGGNFEMIDNTVYKPIDAAVKKAVNRFVSMPVQNPIGKQWIETATALANRNLIKK